MTIGSEADLRWIVVRTAPQREFRVTLELLKIGFDAYCPAGQKFATWTNGRRTRDTMIKVYPVFSRYIFVGCSANRTPQKRSVDHIQAILSDSSGPRFIPSQSIDDIKKLERSRVWDETIFRPEKSLYHPGDAIRIVSGAFAQFPGVVAALRQDFRLDVSLNIFGHQNIIPLETCQIEKT